MTWGAIPGSLCCPHRKRGPYYKLAGMQVCLLSVAFSTVTRRGVWGHIFCGPFGQRSVKQAGSPGDLPLASDHVATSCFPGSGLIFAQFLVQTGPLRVSVLERSREVLTQGAAERFKRKHGKERSCSAPALCSHRQRVRRGTRRTRSRPHVPAPSKTCTCDHHGGSTGPSESHSSQDSATEEAAS